jgi:hypothetical protein
MEKFDEDDLKGANQEAQDLIQVAQLNNTEVIKFLSKLRQCLQDKNVTLDLLDLMG